MTGATSGASFQPPQPLQEPFVLWDSRSWTGALGNGTAGLPNEGSAGSLFDLDVIKRDVGSGFLAWYGKLNSADPVFAGWEPIAASWSDLGGVPCDGPVTMIMAVGAMETRRISGVLTGFADGSAINYFQVRPGVGGGIVHWSQVHALFQNDDYDTSGFAEQYTNGDNFDYPYSIFSYGSTAGDGTSYQKMLLVLTMDPTGGGSAWRYYPIGNTVYPADTLIPVPPDIDFNGAGAPVPTPDRYYELYDTGQGNCDGGSASFPLSPTTEFYLSFEGHQAYVDPVIGEPWNGGIGCALFRGEPSREDIEFWGDYFFNDWVPPATPPIRYTGGNEIRVDATHVYHTFLTNGGSLVPLPGATLPATVDVLTVGGGGEGEDEGPFPRTRPTGGGAGGEAFITSGHPAPTVSAEMNIGSGGSGSGTNTQYDFTGLNTITANGGREGGSTTSGDGGDQFGGGNTGGAANGSAGGGGAGATGNGSAAPTTTQGGDGGPGLVSDWWEGVSREFGKGGGGAGNDDSLGVVPGNGGNTFGSLERGGGGQGANWIASSEVWGGQGLVVVRYLRND